MSEQQTFSLRRRRESITADEVIARLKDDPVTVNKIEMVIAKIIERKP